MTYRQAPWIIPGDRCIRGWVMIGPSVVIAGSVCGGETCRFHERVGDPISDQNPITENYTVRFEQTLDR